jgi:hypothetical protein
MHSPADILLLHKLFKLEGKVSHKDDSNITEHKYKLAHTPTFSNAANMLWSEKDHNTRKSCCNK